MTMKQHLILKAELLRNPNVKKEYDQMTEEFDNAPRTHWNYRVIEFDRPGEEPYYAVHEVHYENDIPVAYSGPPAIPTWEAKPEENGYRDKFTIRFAGMNIILKMFESLFMPVLLARDFPHENAPETRLDSKDNGGKDS